MGSWASYGLGTENANLPGFVVLISSGVQPNGGKNSFGSGFLPSVHQGVQCRSQGDPVLYVSDPAGMNRDLRRMSLDALRDLNQKGAEDFGHPEPLTRIEQYELAFRMQTSVPEVMDISKEPVKTLEAYGAQPGASSLANNCLLARRLSESGVRFVQLFDWGWDFHGTNPNEDIRGGLTKKCATMDKPIAALIHDLKDRGLFDETLIVIGGEFGRTPFREGRTAKGKVLGRDHFPDCFSMVLAGGGVKGGYTHGESDELGFSVGRDKVVQALLIDGAEIRLRPRAPDLPLPRPRLPPHRRARQRGEAGRRVGRRPRLPGGAAASWSSMTEGWPIPPSGNWKLQNHL